MLHCTTDAEHALTEGVLKRMARGRLHGDRAFNKVSATPQELGMMLITLIRTKLDGANGNVTLVDRCRELIDDGADLETRDDKGMTPFLWAAANFRPKILQLLIDRGADAYAQDNAGLSAIEHAKRKKHKSALLMIQTAQMVQLYHHLEHVELDKPVTAKNRLKKREKELS